MDVDGGRQEEQSMGKWKWKRVMKGLDQYTDRENKRRTNGGEEVRRGRTQSVMK